MEFWIMMVQICFVTTLKLSEASFNLGTCSLQCEGQNLVTRQKFNGIKYINNVY